MDNGWRCGVTNSDPFNLLYGGPFLNPRPRYVNSKLISLPPLGTFNKINVHDNDDDLFLMENFISFQINIKL